MANFIEKIFRFDQRTLKKYFRESEKVLAYEQEMAAKSDDELRAKTEEFRQRLKNGASTEEIKYEAFAVAREAVEHLDNSLFRSKLSVR